MQPARQLLWLAGAALPALAPSVASAQEFCVACTQPNAVYRCVIEGARPGGQSLPTLCVMALAKEGGHAGCSIKGGTVFDCNGPIKRVPWAPKATGAAPAPLPPSEPAPAAKTDAKGEPRTVLDLAKQANEKMHKDNETVKEQAKSVGEAIGSTTKKTWDCVVSLFSRC
jgi:hypothetical protein